MALVKDLYRLTAAFPELERYGLTAQLRRGGVSVPSNIAEGYSRTSRREYLRFLGMVRSAIAEIETQLMLARDLDMAAEAEILTVLAGFESLGRMLTRLASSLAVRSPYPRPQPPDPNPEQ